MIIPLADRDVPVAHRDDPLHAKLAALATLVHREIDGALAALGCDLAPQQRKIEREYHDALALRAQNAPPNDESAAQLARFKRDMLHQVVGGENVLPFLLEAHERIWNIRYLLARARTPDLLQQNASAVIGALQEQHPWREVLRQVATRVGRPCANVDELKRWMRDFLPLETAEWRGLGVVVEHDGNWFVTVDGVQSFRRRFDRSMCEDAVVSRALAREALPRPRVPKAK